MKGYHWVNWVWLVGLCAAFSGCGPEASTPSADVLSEPEPRKLGFDRPDAQPKLATIKLWLGSEEVVAEIARTELEIASGLMHRDALGVNEGMLFVMPWTREVAFYMRNTKIPLSIAYIGEDGRILEIHDMAPLDENGRPSKEPNVRFVLEMDQGWFAEKGLGVGALVVTERGGLMETFFVARTP